MESNSSEKAARFGDWTAGCYNLAKIVALLGAALWTLFEWNVSIFPRQIKHIAHRMLLKHTGKTQRLGWTSRRS